MASNETVVATAAPVETVGKAMTEDEIKLAKLGYKQELDRSLHWFHNFGISFTIISVPTGIIPLIGYSLGNGGASVMVWGWLIVFLFVLTVAGSMAEIVSAYPTSGALYWWAAKLGGEKYGPLCSWITGWFNLFGEIGLIAGVGYTFATSLVATILLANPDANISLQATYGIYVAVLVVCGIINSVGEKLLAHTTVVSVVFHLVFIFLAVIWCLVKTPQKMPASWVFQGFANVSGFGDVYAVLLGLLLPQWTFSGYDASAHLSEETKSSDAGASKGIMNAVGISFIAGWFLIIGTLFAIPDESVGELGWWAIISEVLGRDGAIALSSLFCAIVFLCTLGCITSNSRMIYAFSRDGALPGSKWIRVINPATKTPVRAVMVSTLLGCLIALPALGSTVALTALISIGTIGQYLSYGSPILLRITLGKETFKQGPFNLGKYSILVGWIAVIWICFIAIIFCLPSVYPVSASNFNYAPVMVAFVISFSVIYWLVSARKWYKGPVTNVSEEEIAEMEAKVEEKV